MENGIKLSNTLNSLIQDEDLTDEKLREASEGLLPNLADYLNGSDGVSEGVSLIIKERKRQVENLGYSAEVDLTRDDNELIRWALEYIGVNNYQMEYISGSRIENLTKAGALIAAEIDRLQNLQTSHL